MIAVQLVEEGPPHLFPVDQSVLDEAVEDMLDAGIGASRPTGQLTPAAGFVEPASTTSTSASTLEDMAVKGFETSIAECLKGRSGGLDVGHLAD